MFRVANFEKERVLFFGVLREIEKRRKKNLEGKAFWDSLALLYSLFIIVKICSGYKWM